MVKLNNGYVPETVDEAVTIMKDEKVRPYGGGTDLMINEDKEVTYLFLHRIPELKRITEDFDYIRIGAQSTFTDIEESDVAPKILKDALSLLEGLAMRKWNLIKTVQYNL